MGQASAAILAAHVVGRTLAEVDALRDALNAMLKSAGPVPAAPFEAYQVLEPAQDFKNRHASILLAVEATAEAMRQAETGSACA